LNSHLGFFGTGGFSLLQLLIFRATAAQRQVFVKLLRG
jgi:hypothetical protein